MHIIGGGLRHLFRRWDHGLGSSSEEPLCRACLESLLRSVPEVEQTTVMVFIRGAASAVPLNLMLPGLEVSRGFKMVTFQARRSVVWLCEDKSLHQHGRRALSVSCRCAVMLVSQLYLPAERHHLVQ